MRKEPQVRISLAVSIWSGLTRSNRSRNGYLHLRSTTLIQMSTGMLLVWNNTEPKTGTQTWIGISQGKGQVSLHLYLDRDLSRILPSLERATDPLIPPHHTPDHDSIRDPDIDHTLELKSPVLDRDFDLLSLVDGLNRIMESGN